MILKLTLEQLSNRKKVLQEEIIKALERFHNETDIIPSVSVSAIEKHIEGRATRILLNFYVKVDVTI